MLVFSLYISLYSFSRFSTAHCTISLFQKKLFGTWLYIYKIRFHFNGRTSVVSRRTAWKVLYVTYLHGATLRSSLCFGQPPASADFFIDDELYSLDEGFTTVWCFPPILGKRSRVIDYHNRIPIIPRLHNLTLTTMIRPLFFIFFSQTSSRLNYNAFFRTRYLERLLNRTGLKLNFLSCTVITEVLENIINSRLLSSSQN